MAKQFVGFMFPGIDLGLKEKKEVPNRNIESLSSIPRFAYAFRFFEEDENAHETNLSDIHYIGKEYSIKEYKEKYKQAEDFGPNCLRVVKSCVDGRFLPLTNNDIVVDI